MPAAHGPNVHRMLSRAVLLCGLVLALPALAQQPPSFGLASDSIKKIVRDNASTQYASVQMSDAKPIKRNPISAIDFTPPPKKPAPAKLNLPVPQESNGLLDAIVGTILHNDPDDPTRGKSQKWVACKSTDPKATQTYSMCEVDGRQRAPKP